MKFASTQLPQQFQQEREEWALYYEILVALEKGLQEGDPFAENLSHKARGMVKKIMIQVENAPAQKK
jgi:hypothetical protein